VATLITTWLKIWSSVKTFPAYLKAISLKIMDYLYFRWLELQTCLRYIYTLVTTRRLLLWITVPITASTAAVCAYVPPDIPAVPETPTVPGTGTTVPGSKKIYAS